MRGTFLEAEKTGAESGDFCFVGINYCSAEYLKGVEKGAEEIRKHSYRYANADGSAAPLKVYSPEEGYILEDAKFIDYGNVSGSSISELGENLAKIDLPKGAIPIFVGGDHSVTYENIKTLSSLASLKNIVVVQFDAHSDFIDEYEEYPHGSVMNEVSKLSCVDKIIHFGLRGNLNSGPALESTKERGNMVVPYIDLVSKIDAVVEAVKGKTVFITFDTDFLNPVYAPATNCPEPGGPSYEETLNYLFAVISASGNICGMDFVEYNPTCEGATLTGVTLVNIVMECVHYITILKSMSRIGMEE